MLEYQKIDGPHLVLVPKSTLSNWMNEFERWAPTIKAIRFHGDKATRESIIKDQLEPAMHNEANRDWHVCVTTYEICNIEKAALSKFAWSYLIIDEAHRLKNEASTFSRTVRLFETRYRILITGKFQTSFFPILHYYAVHVINFADLFLFSYSVDYRHTFTKFASRTMGVIKFLSP